MHAPFNRGAYSALNECTNRGEAMVSPSAALARKRIAAFHLLKGAGWEAGEIWEVFGLRQSDAEAPESHIHAAHTQAETTAPDSGDAYEKEWEARCVAGGPFDYRGVPVGQGHGWKARIERLEAFMLNEASKPGSGYDNIRQVLSLNVTDGMADVLERVVTYSK